MGIDGYRIDRSCSIDTAQYCLICPSNSGIGLISLLVSWPAPPTRFASPNTAVEITRRNTRSTPLPPSA